MGLFDFFKGSSTPEPQQPVTPQPSVVETMQEQVLDLSKKQPLNMSKNTYLNLSKSGVNLTKVRLAAGWDVNKGRGGSYDLDLVAVLSKSNGKRDVVYYGNKRHVGIYLDGDNLTGEGEGDDENIFINFHNLDDTVTRIAVGVVIFRADSKGQQFSDVQNAYIRLVDETNGQEICRYSLSNEGGSNTALHLGTLEKTPAGEWVFAAVGQYSRDTISSFERKF